MAEEDCSPCGGQEAEGGIQEGMYLYNSAHGYISTTAHSLSPSKFWWSVAGNNLPSQQLFPKRQKYHRLLGPQYSVRHAIPKRTDLKQTKDEDSEIEVRSIILLSPREAPPIEDLASMPPSQGHLVCHSLDFIRPLCPCPLSSCVPDSVCLNSN